jgi:hypothetical protein
MYWICILLDCFSRLFQRKHLLLCHKNVPFRLGFANVVLVGFNVGAFLFLQKMPKFKAKFVRLCGFRLEDPFNCCHLQTL